jgi:hypothetical protein
MPRRPKTSQEQVRTAAAIISEHATAETVWDAVEAILENTLGKDARWILIDGNGQMPVVRCSTLDLAHTIGLLSVSIDVVSENSEQANDDSDGDGEVEA